MFSGKTKALVVEASEFSVLCASVSSLTTPLTVDRLDEHAGTQSSEAIREFVNGLSQGRGRSLAQARCGIFPQNRFLHLANLDNPSKARDAAYLGNLLRNQYQVDPDSNTVAVLSPGSGMEVGAEGTAQREVLFCGAPSGELLSEQERLVDVGLYPERLELGTVSHLGGLVNYCRHSGSRAPTLVLEITSGNSYIFVVNEKGLELARPIPHGLNSLVPQLRDQLGLKDEESARRLFFTNTFDFSEIGPTLLRRLLRELQASIGYYEVQTGQSIGQLCLTLLPPGLKWIEAGLSQALGVEPLRIRFRGWLDSMGIRADDSIDIDNLDTRWIGLFSLMGNFNAEDDAVEKN